MKRLWNLGTNTMRMAPWTRRRSKALFWLSADRRILRCDGCIKYHSGKSHELGITTEQIYEILAVANTAGGSIVIPHTRKGAGYWEELNSNIQ